MSYLRKLKRMKMKPATLYDVTVLHDDNCSIWTTRKCNCEPEIIRKEIKGKKQWKHS